MSHITTPKNNATTGGGILFSMFILLTQETYYLRAYLLLKRFVYRKRTAEDLTTYSLFFSSNVTLSFLSWLLPTHLIISTTLTRGI